MNNILSTVAGIFGIQSAAPAPAPAAPTIIRPRSALQTLRNVRKPSSYPAERRIAFATARIYASTPFFGNLLFNLPLSITEKTEVAAVSRTTLFFNPEAACLLTAPELDFVLCHEVLHIALGHTTTRLTGIGTNRRLANEAEDYIINEILLETLPTTMRAMPSVDGKALGLLDKALTKAGGYTAEGVYAILLNRPRSRSSQGFDEVLTEAEARARGLDVDGGHMEAEAEVAGLAANAMAAAKMAGGSGDIPSGLRRLLQDFLEPQVPWQDLLRRFCAARLADRSERSWRRLSRRGLTLGIMLPAAQPGESMGRLAVAIDCSGSIGEKELAEFAAEVRSIAQDCRPSALHLIYFDATVCHEEVFGPGDEVVVRPYGGGGTAFSPAIRAAASAEEPPDAMIFLTDLGSSDFGLPPAFPVLWVCNSKATKAPFGEIIHMKGQLDRQA